MRTFKNENISDRLFSIFINIFLWLSLIIVLYPLIFVISASFSSPKAVVAGRVWLLPVEPTLMGYQAVFRNRQLLSGFANSVFYTIAGTALNLFMTLLAAFPLSRKELYGRNFFASLFVFPMLFSGGLIPFYLLVRNLGMIDTRWAMIIPAALSVWNVIITRTYLQTTIPDELYEASQIDGCGDIRFLAGIVLPLSGPILAVMALYYGIGHWNTYFNALILLKSQKLFPLQIVLRNILILNTIDPATISNFTSLQRKQGLINLIKYAVIVVASLPLLSVYPFVQKYFVKGVMVGALKG